MEEDEEPSPGESVPMDKEPEPEPEPKEPQAEPVVAPVGPSKKEREPSKLSIEGRSSPRVSPRERLSPKATSPALSPTSSLSPTPSPPDDPQPKKSRTMALAAEEEAHKKLSNSANAVLVRPVKTESPASHVVPSLALKELKEDKALHRASSALAHTRSNSNPPGTRCSSICGFLRWKSVA
jgi:hypothetical protein